MTARRITLVTNELRGSRPVGGIGTGTTFLALALARMGHAVELLHFGTARPVDQEWSRIYEEAGVRIRFGPPSDEPVEPRYFERLPDTMRALQSDPPDVVIAQDTWAPAYGALRLKQLRLAFEQTFFVVVCYGTRLWIKDVSRMARVFPYLLGLSALEGAAIELADAVVSPSNYVIEWMRQQGWQLPASTRVIPYLSRSAATGEEQPRASVSNGHVARLAFFSRLEERKGLKPFAEGLNALDADLLRGIELVFLGAPTHAWPPERIAALLSDTTKAALRGVFFKTKLDQPEALDQLREAGTLAVMPSYGETFGNAVYECLERGIPFIASDAGATPELIATEDHPRVLFEPTAEGVATALRRALLNSDALRPARPAFDAHSAYEQWAELIETARPKPRRPNGAEPRVDVVVVWRSEDGACLAALGQQTYSALNVIVVDTVEHGSVEAARRAGLDAGTAPYVVFLDAGDKPSADFVASLVHAREAAEADVVTCGLRLNDPPRQHLFLGDPGALGLVSNTYGTAALIRRSLLDSLHTAWRVEGDSDWPLLARLQMNGARIVSIPLPLLARREPPGAIERHPSDALLVALEHERALPDSLGGLARLAAGLAAAQHSASTPREDGILRRLRRALSR